MTEKDAGMRIRVERSLREQFVEVCRARDLSAAQVIRAFMRGYVEEAHGRRTKPRLRTGKPE